MDSDRAEGKPKQREDEATGGAREDSRTPPGTSRSDVEDALDRDEDQADEADEELADYRSPARRTARTGRERDRAATRSEERQQAGPAVRVHKDSLLDEGKSEDTAEEIAARTVNKERARHGEAKESSRLSREDIPSGRRGGLRSHRKGPRGRTKDQLYEEARNKGVKGRSKMTKAELARAVGGRS